MKIYSHFKRHDGKETPSPGMLYRTFQKLNGNNFPPSSPFVRSAIATNVFSVKQNNNIEDIDYVLQRRRRPYQPWYGWHIPTSYNIVYICTYIYIHICTGNIAIVSSVTLGLRYRRGRSIVLNVLAMYEGSSLLTIPLITVPYSEYRKLGKLDQTGRFI